MKLEDILIPEYFASDPNDRCERLLSTLQFCSESTENLEGVSQPVDYQGETSDASFDGRLGILDSVNL